ncbi:MAG: hemerythrin family protein [Nitrospinae bacterium]|nr:hemerythrin family protein [Nitrospinota bacterium]
MEKKQVALPVKWDGNLSVGIKSFDDEHKALVGIINHLFANIQANKGKDVLEDIICDLITYARLHFATEEEVMLAYGYPEYEIHKKEHDGFSGKLEDFHLRYRGNEALMMLEVLGSLVEWLETHMCGTDKRYTRFLTDKGIK